MAAPIARSSHPASRRYLATRVRSFRVIGLFLTIASPSALYEATSSELRAISKEIADLKKKLAALEARKTALEREIKT